MQDGEYCAKLKQSNERSLALIKAAMDIVVAAGLLQLYPKKITPRVTGAFGFITSLISCYQVTTTLVIFVYFLSLCLCSSDIYVSLNKHSCFRHDPRSRRLEKLVEESWRSGESHFRMFLLVLSSNVLLL